MNKPSHSIAMLSAMFLLFFLVSCNTANTGDSGNSAHHKFAFNSASGAWTVEKKKGQIIARNSILKTEKIISTDKNVRASNMTDLERTEIASLVGPILTVLHGWYSDHGEEQGRMFLETNMETINLDKGEKESAAYLTDFFPEEEIVAALLKDEYLKYYIGNNHPKTLKDLADIPCDEVSFSDINQCFAFHHIKGDQVAVRIGLPEASSGSGFYEELGIYLKIPPKLADFLKEADRIRLLKIHNKRATDSTMRRLAY